VALILLGEDGTEHQLGGDASAVDAADLTEATGWALKPEGLCRGDECVPLGGRVVAAGPSTIDLAEWAAALRRPLAIDAGLGVAAIVPPATERREALAGAVAPDLVLPDVDGHEHAFSEAAGRKRVLVTWASWCGCRHEIAAWEALHRELGPDGLAIYSVALDESAEAARPWVEAAQPTFPTVVDTTHLTAERYGITNVPSTVWVDEDGRIVKPPTISPGDDQFRAFTNIDAEAHHDALRRWVHDGVVPEPDERPAQAIRTEDEQRALAEFRLASWLQHHDHVEAAAAHLAAAVELAPWDWTVRRAGIALQGGDPFLGEQFLAFWQEWDDAGRPGYGALR
jgi:peroxiredoxin